MNIETTEDAYAAFDEFLNEVSNPIEILGCDYDTARTLLKVDPIAYRCAFNDWADGEGIDTDELEGDLYRHHG